MNALFDAIEYLLDRSAQGAGPHEKAAAAAHKAALAGLKADLMASATEVKTAGEKVAEDVKGGAKLAAEGAQAVMEISTGSIPRD